MKTYTYYLTELRWVTEEEGFGSSPQRARLICTPAEFEEQTSLWSVCVFLDRPVYPGDVITLPVTTLVSEMAPVLLRPGCTFRLKPNGSTTWATGRVLSVEEVDEDENRRRRRFGPLDES